MNLPTMQDKGRFSDVLAQLGLSDPLSPMSDLDAGVLVARYLKMYRLLDVKSCPDASTRSNRRREYLALMRQFERNISTIRMLRRSEMAHTGTWNFAQYLAQGFVIAKCRLSLRLAYIGHFIRLPNASRLAQDAGLKMFGSIFFDYCVPAHT
ncbi:MAG: hypothetical protein JOY62_06090 [Acidobacteriaceae bacterium]|nr:hypothetical protein [Acidobacteriaceae bacterium]MBV9779527.1 hypothetical protein [Acidobacteriaceae bacterium]